AISREVAEAWALKDGMILTLHDIQPRAGVSEAIARALAHKDTDACVERVCGELSEDEQALPVIAALWRLGHLKSIYSHLASDGKPPPKAPPLSQQETRFLEEGHHIREVSEHPGEFPLKQGSVAYAFLGRYPAIARPYLSRLPDLRVNGLGYGAFAGESLVGREVLGRIVGDRSNHTGSAVEVSMNGEWQRLGSLEERSAAPAIGTSFRAVVTGPVTAVVTVPNTNGQYVSITIDDFTAFHSDPEGGARAGKPLKAVAFERDGDRVRATVPATAMVFADEQWEEHYLGRQEVGTVAPYDVRRLEAAGLISEPGSLHEVAARSLEARSAVEAVIQRAGKDPFQVEITPLAGAWPPDSGDVTLAFGRLFDGTAVVRAADKIVGLVDRFKPSNGTNWTSVSSERGAFDALLEPGEPPAPDSASNTIEISGVDATALKSERIEVRLAYGLTFSARLGFTVSLHPDGSSRDYDSIVDAFTHLTPRAGDPQARDPQAIDPRARDQQAQLTSEMTAKFLEQPELLAYVERMGGKKWLEGTREHVDQLLSRWWKRRAAELFPDLGPMRALELMCQCLMDGYEQATDPQATDPQATDPQATDPQATDPQATDPQATDPQILLTSLVTANFLHHPDLLADVEHMGGKKWLEHKAELVDHPLPSGEKTLCEVLFPDLGPKAALRLMRQGLMDGYEQARRERQELTAVIAPPRLSTARLDPSMIGFPDRGVYLPYVPDATRIAPAPRERRTIIALPRLAGEVGVEGEPAWRTCVRDILDDAQQRQRARNLAPNEVLLADRSSLGASWAAARGLPCERVAAPRYESRMVEYAAAAGGAAIIVHDGTGENLRLLALALRKGLDVLEYEVDPRTMTWTYHDHLSLPDGRSGGKPVEAPLLPRQQEALAIALQYWGMDPGAQPSPPRILSVEEIKAAVLATRSIGGQPLLADTPAHQVAAEACAAIFKQWLTHEDYKALSLGQIDALLTEQCPIGATPLLAGIRRKVVEEALLQAALDLLARDPLAAGRHPAQLTEAVRRSLDGAGGQATIAGLVDEAHALLNLKVRRVAVFGSSAQAKHIRAMLGDGAIVQHGWTSLAHLAIVFGGAHDPGPRNLLARYERLGVPVEWVDLPEAFTLPDTRLRLVNQSDDYGHAPATDQPARQDAGAPAIPATFVGPPTVFGNPAATWRQREYARWAVCCFIANPGGWQEKVRALKGQNLAGGGEEVILRVLANPDQTGSIPQTKILVDAIEWARRTQPSLWHTTISAPTAAGADQQKSLQQAVEAAGLTVLTAGLDQLQQALRDGQGRIAARLDRAVEGQVTRLGADVLRAAIDQAVIQTARGLARDHMPDGAAPGSDAAGMKHAFQEELGRPQPGWAGGVRVAWRGRGATFALHTEDDQPFVSARGGDLGSHYTVPRIIERIQGQLTQEQADAALGGTAAPADSTMPAPSSSVTSASKGPWPCLIVAGSRAEERRGDPVDQIPQWQDLTRRILDNLREREGFAEVVSGGAEGMDSLGARYGAENNVPVTVFPVFEAEWDQWKRANRPKGDGNPGMQRNGVMAEYAVAMGGAAVVIHGNTAGSRDMVVKARAKGVPVHEYQVSLERLRAGTDPPYKYIFHQPEQPRRRPARIPVPPLHWEALTTALGQWGLNSEDHLARLGLRGSTVAGAPGTRLASGEAVSGQAPPDTLAAAVRDAVVATRTIGPEALRADTRADRVANEVIRIIFRGQLAPLLGELGADYRALSLTTIDQHLQVRFSTAYGPRTMSRDLAKLRAQVVAEAALQEAVTLLAAEEQAGDDQPAQADSAVPRAFLRENAVRLAYESCPKERRDLTIFDLTDRARPVLDVLARVTSQLNPASSWE
ncbi:MAG TPA: hypothetical protein VNL71_15015, partial [Chloroflexota bacterium]|nr:hypothetical protein [Chloroflexota bacterium]